MRISKRHSQGHAGEVVRAPGGQQTLFDLFPCNPSKQAGKIAGLPESMRKGGY
jgi:sulfur relay (sulfurtransferase) DsrC/TusE family protein